MSDILSGSQHAPLCFLSSISAGFPSPAADYADGCIDLNEKLISHPAATYFLRVAGHSMIGAGIFDGDLLIVDSSLTPKDSDIVIAALDGEFTVKRLDIKGGRLVAENPDYAAIAIPELTDFQIFGVVTFVIHQVK